MATAEVRLSKQKELGKLWNDGYEIGATNWKLRNESEEMEALKWKQRTRPNESEGDETKARATFRFAKNLRTTISFRMQEVLWQNLEKTATS